MPLSTDVNLPRNHTARFPAACVRCGDDPAGASVRLWTHSVGWWTWVFWSFGRAFSTRVPACKSCGWRIRIQRVSGLAITIVVAFVFLAFLWPQLDGFVARPFRKWAGMGLVLVSLAPYLLWETIFPPPIDITAYSDNVDYEFKDPKYASHFAKLNKDAAWVRID